MRILAAADLHGDYEVYRWLVEMARIQDPAAVVLAGDLLGCPDPFESPEAAQIADRACVLELLDALRRPVLYVMGNDDWVDLQDDAQDASPWYRALHGRRVDLGKFNFVGYQYSLPFMGGVNERTEADIELDLRRIEGLIDSATVLVTHSPAFGTLDTGMLDRPSGSSSLARLVAGRAPRAHLHGHIHHEFGRSGRHFNVASGRHKRAISIDLQTMEHEILAGGR